MIKIMKTQWDKNKANLFKTLAARADLGDCEYIDLVRETFEVIYNTDLPEQLLPVDTSKITMIDNGDYQGTLLFALPFVTYQPAEFEYLMTYVGYGSCSGCDALLFAQSGVIGKANNAQLSLFMNLCKDIAANTIRPYNVGWRADDDFGAAED